MPSFGFIGPDYAMENLAADGERLVNMYPVQIESGMGASRGAKYAYVHAPGYELFATLPASPVRAMWGGNNRLFVMASNKVYELNVVGAVIGTWTIGSASGPGQIVSNGEQLLAWDGSTAPSAFNTWLLEGGGASTAVISSVGITYMNGYFVALRPGGADFGGDPVPVNTINQTQFNWSAPLDGSSWDPLDYIIKTSSPDAVVSIVGPGSYNGGPQELMLMGKKTICVFYNSAFPPPADPFSEVSGAFTNIGVWAKASVVGFPHSIVFLSADDRGFGHVVQMNGYTPVVISDYAMENRIRQLAGAGDGSNAIAFGYLENGHEFYVVTWPDSNVQLVIDLQTRQMHERAKGTTPSNINAAPPAMFHASAFGRHYVGDLNSGKIFEMKRDCYQTDSVTQIRMRVSPHMNNERKIMFYKDCQLDVGGPFTSNRTYNLDNSSDGGINYATSKAKTVGPSGDSLSRVIWRRNGRARDRVVRIWSVNNAPEFWVDGYVDAEPGTGM